MQIEYRVGDLLTTECPVLLHGCNQQGAMNSGIAKTIRDVYPMVFATYREQYDSVGLVLGSTIPVKVPSVLYEGVEYPERLVINCITQEFAGREPIRYVSYDAVAKVIESINQSCSTDGNTIVKVAMPLIGAGLANGDWVVIARLIETLSTNFIPVVYVLTNLEMARIDAMFY